ncbi:hypothetical protein ACH498_25125 [Rhodococcus erythropolis]
MAHPDTGPREQTWQFTDFGETLIISTPPGTATIEMSGPLAAAVEVFLHANRLDGPTVVFGDSDPRRLYLVTGINRTHLAARYLETAGAHIRAGTHSINLPGPRRWWIRKGTRDWTPPIVALAAAARAAEACNLLHDNQAAHITREVSHA